MQYNTIQYKLIVRQLQVIAVFGGYDFVRRNTIRTSCIAECDSMSR